MTHRRHIPRLLTVAVCAALGASVLIPATGAGAAQSLPRATADRPDDRSGPQVRYLYLLPADAPDKRLDTNGTIADSVDAGNRWLQERTGRLLDTDTAGGVLDVTFVRLPRTAAQYEAAGVLGAVQDDLRAMGQDDGQDTLLGYYAGVDGNRRCGEAYIGPGRRNDSSFLALVFDVQPDGFSSCTVGGFAGEGEPARAQDINMVHELFHAAGAVTRCAPHADGKFHVSDDDTDLMADAGNPQVVDVNNDDYFELDPSSPCTDVAKSELLLPARAPADQDAAPADVSPGVASTFVPVTPTRLLDTRSGLGAPEGRLAAGESLRLAVTGRQTPGGAVPATATAVVLNVTALAAGNTDIRAYPAGGSVPLASNVNAISGQTVPNLVTVPLSQDGQVGLFSSGGPVHLLADIAGYYLPGAEADGYAPLAPARVLDTRSGLGAPAGALEAGGVRDLQVTGALPTADGGTVTVPADASAVVLNVTGTGVSASTDVRVYPTPSDTSTGAVPTVSNLNLTRGQTAANLATVKVGTGGAVRLRNNAGTLSLIADVAGYYAPDAPGRFVPVTPLRLLDTRNGTGTKAQPLPAGGRLSLAVAGDRGIPAEASAAVLNLTATGVSASTDIRAYPADAEEVPTVSNLNLTRGSTRANAATVRLGAGGDLALRNNSGRVELITDIAGYFLP